MLKTIVFQGDSITDAGRNYEVLEANTGFGEGYPLFVTGQLQAMYPEAKLQCFNRGISGNRVVDLYARWKIDALNLKPDFMSILIGINDVWHEKVRQNGVETERFEFVYRELLKWTRAVLPNVQLLLMEPFALEFDNVKADWLPDIREKQEVVHKMVKEFDTLYLPCQEILDAAAAKNPSAGLDHWLRDGVHPAYAGHALFAQAWIEKIKPFMEA